MAFPSILITDFNGQISLSQSLYGAEDFEDFVNEAIIKYTNLVLGAKASYQIETLSLLKYDKLMEGYTYTYINDDLEEEYGYFAGFIKFLKYMIYFEIVRNDFQMTDAGATNNKNENTDKVRQYAIAQDRYNKAVDFLNDVFSYMENLGTLSYSFDTISEVATLYSVSVLSATQPLFQNDEVIQLIDPRDSTGLTTIDATISNITWNGVDGESTFDFTAETGIAFESFEYTPYIDVKTTELKKTYL